MHKQKKVNKMTKLEQYAPPMCLIIVLLFFTLGLCAQEMPKWVMPGLAKIETESYHNGAKWIYVNQNRGTAGEIGIWQALPSTLREYKMSPSLFEQDNNYAESCVLQILQKYYSRCGNWDEAVGAWRKGYHGRLSKTAKNYAKSVRNAGSNVKN
jgi:hypothetical protein